MNMTFWRLVTTTLVVVVAVSACNDDTSSSPTGPQDDEQPVVDDEVNAFFGELSETMAGVIPVLLFGEGDEELPGSGGGRIVVEGTTLTFEDYSLDGETTMTGVIVIEILASLWNITGTLTLSGVNEGEVVVAMTLDPFANPPAPGVTVTIDGTDYDVAELSAQSAEG